MKYTDKEIYENRVKWITLLKNPRTEKARGVLERVSTEKRCCLGHACHTLGEARRIDRDTVYYGDSAAYLSTNMRDRLGMWGHVGKLIGTNFFNLKYNVTFGEQNKFKTLAALNDNTDITPQEVGNYLQGVILGGDDTPFREIKL